MKIIYVVDTSVFLTDANSIYSYGKNDIIIPLKVLEEIDNHKKRQDTVGTNARKIIRILDELRECEKQGSEHWTYYERRRDNPFFPLGEKEFEWETGEE